MMLKDCFRERVLSRGLAAGLVTADCAVAHIILVTITPCSGRNEFEVHINGTLIFSKVRHDMT